MVKKRSGGDQQRTELKSLPESAESAALRAQRLRQKAEELRAVAESMSDPSARRSLLCLAEDYERLSNYASNRAELVRRFNNRMAG